MTRSLLAVLVTFALLTGCGGSSKDAATPDDAKKDDSTASKGDAEVKSEGSGETVV